MTETTQIVFNRYQIRKTKTQKREFAMFAEQVANYNGYRFTPEMNGSSCNLVVGDPYNADVIFTAHYDTCPRFPFPNFLTPKNFFIYLVYQIFLAAVILIPYIALLAASIVLSELGTDLTILVGAALRLLAYLIVILMMILLIHGPANKHTANDNTSGVTTLLDLMHALPAELRHRAAFIFFDNEELGLLGSRSYYRRHKKVLSRKLLINFDCVSDGNNMLFTVNKKARSLANVIDQAFAEANNGDFHVEVAPKGVFFPSDQLVYPMGVGVGAFNKSKRLGILYMDKIHTNKDTIYMEQNIDFLVRGSVNLTKKLSAR